MQDEIINNLLEALAVSPGNIPLRMQLASMMVQAGRTDEAAGQYSEVLKLHYGHVDAQKGLATCYSKQGKHSAAIIIFEQVQAALKPAEYVIYIRSLIAENSMRQAIEEYQKLMALNPGFRDDELDKLLRAPAMNVSNNPDELLDQFSADDSYFMEKP